MVYNVYEKNRFNVFYQALSEVIFLEIKSQVKT